jgi:hypothetical protein
MSLLSIFRRPKSRMLQAEENTISMNKDVFDLLLRCDKHNNELREEINSEKPYLKDAKLAELENDFLNIRSKIDAMQNEMRLIIDIETQNKDFIGFNDDTFIQDKLKNLEAISAALEEVLELVAETPSLNDLKGVVDFIHEKINFLLNAVNSIINDDRNLEVTYSKIPYL